MCLIKTHRFPKRSNKSITVFKELFIINGKYRTPFIDLEVNIGDTIKAKKHWFWGIFKKTITSEGVHAYSILTQRESCLKPFFRIVYIEAEIPPHTPYWIGKHGNIAASELKLIKVL